jgi:predicted metal-dependent hydrolase
MSRTPEDKAILAAGVAAFNDGRYFACHEILETLWLPDVSPERDLLKGLIQVAAGLHHQKNGNVRGCRKLLLRATQLLTPYSPAGADLDIAGLLGEVAVVLAFCESAAPGDPLPPALVPRLRPAGQAPRSD